MILFDSYLKSPFYLVNLYEYFEKKYKTWITFGY